MVHIVQRYIVRVTKSKKMAAACEDLLTFVLLVEQHSDVLLKSQTNLNKKKRKQLLFQSLKSGKRFLKLN